MRKDLLESSRVVEFLKKSRLHIDKIRYIWSLAAGDNEKTSITQNEFNLLMRLVALDQSAKEVSLKNAFSTDKVKLPHFDGIITPAALEDEFDEYALQFSYRNKSMITERKNNQEDEFGDFVDSVGTDNQNPDGYKEPQIQVTGNNLLQNTAIGNNLVGGYLNGFSTIPNAGFNTNFLGDGTFKPAENMGFSPNQKNQNSFPGQLIQNNYSIAQGAKQKGNII